MYQWQQIKEHRLKGMSIKGLARKFKVSKNTIRKYLREEGLPVMKKRVYGSQVEPFKAQVELMIEKKMIGTRIFNELKQKGFEGSQSSVHRYLQKMGKSAGSGAKMSSRFETGPGEQMQYDWKEWSLQIGMIPIKLYIHSLILSFSRKKFYVISLTITTATILQAIYEGMVYFGGFARELVIDNPKQMVLVHRKSGEIRYNDAFLKFCGLFGIIPNPCENYRPQTKGKVERPFLYLQEHFLRGLEVRSLAELEARLQDFTQTVNARYHSGIETTPDDRFDREKPELKGFPCVDPSSWRVREIRKVSRDGYISLGAKFYPVPMALCGKQVAVESVFGKTFTVVHAGAVICEVEQRLEGPALVPHPEHVKINSNYGESRRRKRALPALEFIQLFGDRGEVFFEGLRRDQRENLYFHLKEILRFIPFYEHSDTVSVLEDCISMDTFHKNTVKRLLTTKPLKPTVVVQPGGVVPRPSAPISRSLSVYKELTHV